MASKKLTVAEFIDTLPGTTNPAERRRRTSIGRQAALVETYTSEPVKGTVKQMPSIIEHLYHLTSADLKKIRRDKAYNPPTR